jgi:hypothetical protein
MMSTTFRIYTQLIHNIVFFLYPEIVIGYGIIYFKVADIYTYSKVKDQQILDKN